MLYPVFSWLKLILSVMELIVGSLTIAKVYYGSKSGFSYTQLTFTILYGLNGLAYFIILSKTREVAGEKVPDFYAFYTTRFWYFILSLQ